jgi:xanthine dehydrogenase accessory factor
MAWGPVFSLAERPIAVVRGGGDLASGAVFRLWRAGFRVLVLELAAPLLVRRTVCYGDAVFEGVRTVEGVTARLIRDPNAAEHLWAAGEIPVMIDPDGAAIAQVRPFVLVDARMEKRNLGTRRDDAPCVIALGPGFTAGEDCHAVVETNRGHRLGRVYTAGAAEPDTGEPGAVGGKTHSRILRAPAPGHVEPLAAIGDRIAEGSVIARVGDAPIVAAFAGVLRGLIHPSVQVWAGLKVGDLDPRADLTHCFTLSDKSLSVGGGVLEAAAAAVYAARAT